MTAPAPATESELREALAELQRLDERKDRFLAQLGHELRNGLTPLRIALQVLGMPGMDAVRSRELRETTDRQLVRMVRMIDDLMDVSQLGRGKLVLRREPVELAMVVDNAIEISRAEIDARGHSLETHLPTSPVVVDADANRLAQVIGELLRNAARCTEPGGRIALSVRRLGDEVELAVQDSGRGLTPEMLQAIFLPFGSHEGKSRRSEEGLGIGLALARGLVALHQGTLAAQSDGPGKGSRFVLRLPLASSSA